MRCAAWHRRPLLAYDNSMGIVARGGRRGLDLRSIHRASRMASARSAWKFSTMERATVANRWNLDLIEDYYSRWLKDPASVDGSWRLFFEGFETGREAQGLA